MYFEDLVDKFEDERRPMYWVLRAGVPTAFLLLLGTWLLIVNLYHDPGDPGALAVPLLLVLAVSFFALFAAPFLNWRRERRAGPVGCPHCQGILGVYHREQIFKTRACPLCGWVFRSRLPPQARKITFDPAKLPRVWLQGELETAKVVDEPAPLVADDADDTVEPNPYRASAVVTPPSVGMGAATQGCLTAWWQSVIGPPMIIFSSREKILRDPHLAVLAAGDADRQRERDDAFVRSQRRTAWLLLLCCHAPPLAFIVLYWQQSPHEELTTRLLLAVGGGLLVSLLGLFFAAMLLSLSPRSLKRFWMGSRGPVRASLDPATGYFGIRIRILHHAQQDQLPRVRFRYRCSQSGPVQLRLVKFPQAEALELELAPADAERWREADCDLLLLVRQSDPDFAGDEMHLVADPAAKLECSDFDVLPRF